MRWAKHTRAPSNIIFAEIVKVPILLQCFGSSKLHRVCKYYNLLLWNGTLYYPTTGEHLLTSVQHILYISK